MTDGAAYLIILGQVRHDKEIKQRSRQLDVVMRFPLDRDKQAHIGSFRFFNIANIEWSDDAVYLFHVKIAGMNAQVPLNDVASPFVRDAEDVHLIGDIDDIPILGPLRPPSLAFDYRPCVYLSGIATRLTAAQSSPPDDPLNIENDPNSSFNMNIMQYTTVMKKKSVLPVRATFPTTPRFKKDHKPIPSSGATVFVQGIITGIRYPTDDCDFPAFFLVEITEFTKLPSPGSPSTVEADAVTSSQSATAGPVSSSPLADLVIARSPRKAKGKAPAQPHTTSMPTAGPSTVTAPATPSQVPASPSPSSETATSTEKSPETPKKKPGQRAKRQRLDEDSQ